MTFASTAGAMARTTQWACLNALMCKAAKCCCCFFFFGGGACYCFGCCSVVARPFLLDLRVCLFFVFWGGVARLCFLCGSSFDPAAAWAAFWWLMRSREAKKDNPGQWHTDLAEQVALDPQKSGQVAHSAPSRVEQTEASKPEWDGHTPGNLTYS